ncbi:S1C family serine protease [Tepidiphilus baoligensis]|uniref:PDZ domain-containing protein n=1 Tax=Tepidiphilus baoligensis TaxID=2698687 RepID=A0ABX1QKM8_9PROT|nr:trypsin-like peptidase domain-containing protein [Tepidiphilus baoligensis]NMH15763.1 PDZ domain-containing protein [Tepidiphilus baoligensis]
MKKLWQIFAQTVTVVALAGFVVAHLKPHWWFDTGAPLIVERDAPTIPAPAAKDYRFAAARGASAVVSLQPMEPNQAENGETPRPLQLPEGHPEVPLPDEDSMRLPEAMGSAVIVTDDGVLVTNAHVVQGHERFLARFGDGRSVPARVAGRDQESDLAILRLEDSGPFPALPFAPPDSFDVGDVVLAVGHPFGVGQTVTMGIISALGRNDLGLSTFENFIQTDAAINPGNSGGALVDTQGRLLGINTAIFSRTGGSLGIGFAIPVQIVQPVVAELSTRGYVRRGWVGVQLQPLENTLADAMGIITREGALVAAVLPDSPAAAASLKPGDVILAIDGKPTRTVREVLDMVAATPPGKEITLWIERERRTIEVRLVTGERPHQGS